MIGWSYPEPYVMDMSDAIWSDILAEKLKNSKL